MRLDYQMLDKHFKAILGKTGDNTYQTPRLDKSTHALETIEYEHHEIHSGSSFTAYYTITTAATNGHRSGLYIMTPIAKEIHAIISFSASVAANFSLCEAPTIAADTGTDAVVIYNRNRNSSKSSLIKDNAAARAANRYTTLTEAQIAGDGTWATGTVIRTEPLIAGGGPKPAGGESRGEQEYILKHDTAYVFLITNTVATANTHHILLDWYEHTPRSA